MTDRKLVYGVTTARDRGTIKAHEKTWPAIIKLFEQPTRRKITMAQYAGMSPKDRAHSKNTGLFFGGDCRVPEDKDNKHRGSDDLVARSIVNLDLDDHCADIWAEFQQTGEIAALAGHAYLVHSTRSHTDEKPKFRILIPLLKDVSPAEYEPVARGIAELLDESMMAAARESFTPAQGMYFPSVSADQKYYFTAVDGDFFDAKPLLKKYPADKASTWPKRPKESVTEYTPGRRMTHPEEKKAQAPIIAALHRAFDPHTFIETFLDDAYFASGDRYSPHGATGAPSVRIYDDTFIQSDHGSDPAVGQHNTFDLGRIHLFRHLDDDFDTDNLSPAEWPSYKAMAEWALAQEGVAEHLADVEDEVREERIGAYLDDLPDMDDDEDEPEEEDEDDLVGGAPEKKKKPKTADELIRRLRKLLGKADTMDAVEAAAQRVQKIPDDVLSDSARSVLCTDLQAAYERCGEKLTKANAAKALRYRSPSAQERAGDEIPKWADGWCYVYGESSFHHADSNRLLTKEGFDALFMMPMGKMVGFTNSGTPVMSASTAALTVWEMQKAYGMQFHPGREEIFTEDGVTFVNRYRKAVIPDDGYRGKRGVELLIRLLRDLYPDKRHRELIMDYLAHMYRYPAKKLKYALLLKGANEEGKTLLYRLMRRVLGKNNCATVQTSQLKKEFNDFIDGKLLCCIEEIKLSGKDGAEALNNLKAPITNQDVSVEGKGTKVRNIDNYCNWLVFTNFEDAVPIEDDDSRWLIIFSRFKTNEETAAWKEALTMEEGGDYRDALYDEIEQHPWQFIRYFEKYKFSGEYKPNARAPKTVFKRLMTEDGRSEERVILEEMLAGGSNALVTDGYVHTSELRDAFEARNVGATFRGRGVAALMKGAGFMKCRPTMLSDSRGTIRVDGWTRNPEWCDVEGKLSEEAREKIKQAFAKYQQEEEDDLESLV